MARRASPFAVLGVLVLLAGCLADGPRSEPAPPAPADDDPLTANRPPRAVIEATEGPVTVGDPVRVDGAASHDPENGTLRFRWDMGDGARYDGPTVEHVFAAAGVFTVALAVHDPEGLSGNASRTITVLPRERPYAWHQNGTLLVANPFMERFGRDAPFLDTPWPLVGGDTLAAFQARALGSGIDHVVYRVEGVPTDLDRLAFVLEWDPRAVAPLFDTVVDLDLFVFDADGDLLSGGWMAATGAVPETFLINATEELRHGTYQALVLLFRGTHVPFMLRADVTVPPTASGTIAWSVPSPDGPDA